MAFLKNKEDVLDAHKDQLPQTITHYTVELESNVNNHHAPATKLLVPMVVNHAHYAKFQTQPRDSVLRFNALEETSFQEVLTSSVKEVENTVNVKVAQIIKIQAKTEDHAHKWPAHRANSSINLVNANNVMIIHYSLKAKMDYRVLKRIAHNQINMLELMESAHHVVLFKFSTSREMDALSQHVVIDKS